MRATLSNGGSHTMHRFKPSTTYSSFRARRLIKFDFRDSWSFNVAGYRVDH